MYWPVGTPRIYATSNSSLPANVNIVVSHDGLPSPTPDEKDMDKADGASLLTADSASSLDVPVPVPATPITPTTPFTPGIKPVEHDVFDASIESSSSNGNEPAGIPLKEPILALRVSRLGQIFAVMTATSMTIWQAKV